MLLLQRPALVFQKSVFSSLEIVLASVPKYHIVFDTTGHPICLTMSDNMQSAVNSGNQEVTDGFYTKAHNRFHEGARRILDHLFSRNRGYIFFIDFATIFTAKPLEKILVSKKNDTLFFHPRIQTGFFPRFLSACSATSMGLDTPGQLPLMTGFEDQNVGVSIGPAQQVRISIFFSFNS